MLIAMETDSFFWKLLKQLPETLFELLELPPQRARCYRFDSVEVKKSFRSDGLYLPRKVGLPLYFVEWQSRNDLADDIVAVVGNVNARRSYRDAGRAIELSRASQAAVAAVGSRAGACVRRLGNSRVPNVGQSNPPSWFLLV